jgi:hypothetical protein
MIRSLVTATLLLLASLPAAAQTAGGAQKHPDGDFFMAGIAAFNAHNLDGFMKQFASDIEMYTPAGWLRGHQSVRERFAQTFRQFPGVRMDIEGLRVRKFERGAVVTDFKWRVYPTGEAPAFHGVGSGGTS